MPIKEIKARKVMNSQRKPTIEVILKSDKGTFRASTPSGASTGKYEAKELNVKKAINNINKKIKPRLLGKDPTKQKEIDQIMIKLDNTKNKSKLGANAILAVSIAVCRAGAKQKNISLYKHIQELSENKKPKLPTPQLLLLEGGKHAKNSSDIQEFMILPKAKTFREKFQKSKKIYNTLKKILRKNKLKTTLGFEGAFHPNLKSNEKFFEIITQSIKQTGLKPKKDIEIAIDAAASEFYKNKKYNLKIENKTLNQKTLSDFYKSLIKKYPIKSIEDPFDQDDWKSWSQFNSSIKKIQIVGDDLLTTNPDRIKKAIKLKACNTLILKPNQIGTITESIKAYHLAKKAGWKIIVSHRSGETKDSFIADLAVGLATDQIKTGSPSKPERMSKYNRLLKIEKEMKIQSTSSNRRRI